MRICLLSANHPPFDKRVFDKEAVALAQAGHDVVHLAPGDGSSERREGVEVITYRRSKGLWGRFMHLPALYRRASQLGAEVYHCNEVDSWVVGVALKLMRRCKIVFDVHEHYPSTFSESRFAGPLRPLVAAAVRGLFRLLVGFTDRIVLAKPSVAADFKGAEHKQVLVQNYARLVFRDRHAPLNEEGAQDRPVTAIHLGLMSRLRGWPQLLDAMSASTCPDLHLRLVGTFNDGSQPDFERIAKAYGLRERIDCDEWLPFEQAYERVLASDIGLVLFQPGVQNHVYASPHKMFDYMLAGLPVIAPAFAQEVAQVITAHDCGILVDPSDPQAIASALDFLVSQPAERRRMGLNGRQAVIECYNWEAEAAKLVAMYEQMAAART